MSLKKNRKKRWSALFAGSRILSFFMAVAISLYNKAACSISGRIFTSYDEHAGENSFICRLFGRLETGRRVFRPVKRTVSRLVSQSIVLEKTNVYLKGWLYTRLNVFGLIAITMGVGQTLIQLLKHYGLGIEQISFSDMFVSLLLIVLSVPLMLSQTPLNEAVCRSRGTSALIFGWLGCKKEVFEEKGTLSHSKTALPIGVLICALSWWIRPLVILGLLSVLVMALTVLYIPETGIVCLVFLLPFLSPKVLSLLIVYNLLCFLLKYVRGKRTLKFDPLATAVLALAVMSVPLSGFSVTGYLGVCTFFLIINLIKSRIWIGRCITSVVFASFLTGFYGLASYISVELEMDYLIYLLNADGFSGMSSFFSAPAVFACYIVLTLPIVAGAGRQRGKGMIAFLAMVLNGVCLFLTESRVAWMSLLIGMVLFMVLYSKKALAAMGILLCALPFLFINVPGVFLDSSSYSRLSEYVVHEMFGNIHGHVNIITVSCVLLFGCVMFLCFQKNITLYSKGCSGIGKLVSLGALTGLISFLMMGTSAVVYAEYETALMFWIVLGICACVGGTERNNTIRSEYSEYEYSKGDSI